MKINISTLSRLFLVSITFNHYNSAYAKNDSIEMKINKIVEYKYYKKVNLSILNFTNSTIKIDKFNRSISNICDSTFDEYELLWNNGRRKKLDKPNFWFMVYKNDTLFCHNHDQYRINGFLGYPCNSCKSIKKTKSNIDKQVEVITIQKKSKVDFSILINNLDLSNLIEENYDLMIRYDGFVLIGNRVIKINLNTNRCKYKFKPLFDKDGEYL
jgi:hypothetical protein